MENLDRLQSRFLFRNLRQKYLAVGLTLIILELIIVLHSLQLFNLTANNTKFSPITWQWQPSTLTADCRYHFQWYVFTVPDCSSLAIGEHYQLFGRPSQVIDRVFFKQISLIVQQKEQIELQPHSVKTWFGILLQKRARLQLLIASLLEENYSVEVIALIQGLLFGDDSSVPTMLASALSNSGLQHILAASGYNVGLVVSGMLPLTGFLIPGRNKYWLVILGIWGYVFLAAGGASLLRAGSAATWTFLSRYRHHPTQAWWSTAVGVFFLTAIFPYLWWDIGFQLSLAATLGILIWQNPRSDQGNFSSIWLGIGQQSAASAHSVFQSARHYLRESLLVSWAAMSGVFPLLLHHFGTFSLRGLISTTLVAWLLPLATLAAVLSSIVAVLTSGVGILDIFVAVPLETMVQLIDKIGKSSWGIWQQELSASIVLAWWLGVVAIAVYQKKRLSTRVLQSKYKLYGQ